MTAGPATIGVDIGGTNIRAAIVSPEGELGARLRFPTAAQRGPKAVVDDLAGRLREMIAAHGGRIGAVGAGCPGPLSTPQGIVFETPNLPGWDRFPLRDELAARLGLPVVIHNDANAAAWGEFTHGAARGADTVIMYTLGTGVGGDLVIDRKLRIGPDTTAGELGHTVLVPHGRPCGCGSRGCLEAYASATAVASRAREAIAHGRESSLQSLPPQEITSHHVDHAADAGDRLAQEILQEAGFFLGLAAASLVNALNPDLIVYGGGMVNARLWLFPVIEKTIHEYAFKAPAARVRIAAASLGDDAGIVGAAALALAP